MQPPLLGNCQYDKMYVTANGDYPLLCGQNSGKAYIFIVTSDYIMCYLTEKVSTSFLFVENIGETLNDTK